MERKYNSLERPKLRNQKIIAWGYFGIRNNHGFNIILIEEDGSIYGKWYILKNKLSSFYQKPQNVKEPIAIDLESLEKEINHLNVMGSRFDSEIIEGDKFIVEVNEIIVQNI